MKTKKILLPLFLLWLIAINLKSSLVFVLHPILKQKFFLLSLLIFSLYTIFLGKWLFIDTTPSTIKFIDLKDDKNIVVFRDYHKLEIITKKLQELESLAPHPTLILANLALVKFYQNEQTAYQNWWQAARETNPNHPIFK